MGAPAADFALPAHTGETFRLGERLAEGRVLLVFYPFAFSSVCGSELDQLAGLDERLRAAGVSVAAVSADSKFALAAYAEQAGLPFELLSDFWPHGHVARQYDAFDESSGMATRQAFLIARDGAVVRSVSSSVSTPRDFTVFLDPD